MIHSLYLVINIFPPPSLCFPLQLLYSTVYMNLFLYRPAWLSYLVPRPRPLFIRSPCCSNGRRCGATSQSCPGGRRPLRTPPPCRALLTRPPLRPSPLRALNAQSRSTALRPWPPRSRYWPNLSIRFSLNIAGH